MKTMINDCWIVSVFGIYYGFRTVETFRIIRGKGMVNGYWIACVFVIVSVSGIQYDWRIIKAFRIFIGKVMANDYWMV